ncbi:hypothetical protein ACH35V_06780 [Actinomadura sp. 1N219]|uniref:hypothetical protein n=1 Tax=Actinomadura sp. 1N219 TaxID=3375152 RepID=UPI00379D913D
MTTRTRTRTTRPTRTRTARTARTGGRTRRTRRGGYRLAFADRFMLAGSAGGAMYLLALHLVDLPTGTATAAGLLVFAFALGVLVTVKRLPRLRALLGRARR